MKFFILIVSGLLFTIVSFFGIGIKKENLESLPEYMLALIILGAAFFAIGMLLGAIVFNLVY